MGDNGKMREQEIREDFGRRVRYYRERLGWQQEDLALRIGKTKSNVSRIETGKQNVSVADIKSIARALEVRVANLLDDNEQEVPDDRVDLIREEAAQCVRDGRRAMADVNQYLDHLEKFATATA
jgi:transcriptional regulator with XRE-family HTH domain